METCRFSFKAMNKAREHEINVLSRHRNFPFWFLKSYTKQNKKKPKFYQAIETSRFWILKP